MPLCAFLRRYICDCLYFGVLTFVFIHMGICIVAFSRLYTHGIIRYKRTATLAHDLSANFCWLCSRYHVHKLQRLFLPFLFECKPNVDFFLSRTKESNCTSNSRAHIAWGFFREEYKEFNLHWICIVQFFIHSSHSYSLQRSQCFSLWFCCWLFCNCVSLFWQKAVSFHFANENLSVMQKSSTAMIYCDGGVPQMMLSLPWKV